MFRPRASITYNSAASAMRTQALPCVCSTSGNTSSATAATANTAYLFCRSMKCIMLPASCAVRHTLAQQSGRPQGEHRNQHDEGEDVRVVAAQHAAGERADVARPDRL